MLEGAAALKSTPASTAAGRMPASIALSRNFTRSSTGAGKACRVLVVVGMLGMAVLGTANGRDVGNAAVKEPLTVVRRGVTDGGGIRGVALVGCVSTWDCDTDISRDLCCCSSLGLGVAVPCTACVAPSMSSVCVPGRVLFA